MNFFNLYSYDIHAIYFLILELTDNKNSNSTNQFNRQDRRLNDDRVQLTVTINREMPGSRLFNNALVRTCK